MGTYREHDPLVEFMQEKHAGVLDCIRRVVTGDAPVRELGNERELIQALAAAEASVLRPSFERVALRPDTRRLLDDCEGDRAAQIAALDCVMRSRSPRIRKLKALELSDLVQAHDERYVNLLVPVLRSQLPRTFYRALANAFAACLDARLTGEPQNSNVSTEQRPAVGLSRASEA